MNTLKAIIIALLAPLTIGCTDESGAKGALESQGFTDVVITGYAGPFSCGEDDFSTTGFRAKNNAGNIVEGVVCCGLVFKSCTVRW